MEAGRPPQKSSRLLRSRPGAKKEYLCVCVCACACQSVCVYVFPRPAIPCVCVHVFVKKKKKMEKKNLNNKCFICFKGLVSMPPGC